MTAMPRLPLATPLIALALTTASAESQQPPALTMLGFVPGAPETELQQQVAKLGGKLECKISPVERRITECSSPMIRADDGRRWSLLASLVNGSTAIVLLRSTVAESELAQLTRDLVVSLGRPNLRQQRDEITYEWIRAGRSMRLASRSDRGRTQISVSLIDGPLLDGLGAR